jgi:hypothetical protein
MPRTKNPATPRFEASELAPFTLVLAEPVENLENHEQKSTRAYKRQLNDLTGQVLSPNFLGQLAKGLVKGRLSTLFESEPVGLYEGAFDEVGNLRGITFLEPTQLYEAWPKAELQAGEMYQQAIRNLIEAAVSHEPPINH